MKKNKPKAKSITPEKCARKQKIFTIEDENILPTYYLWRLNLHKNSMETYDFNLVPYVIFRLYRHENIANRGVSEILCFVILFS